jgi:hypothetical protein
MTTFVASFLTRELIGSLVNALLRPVYLRMRADERQARRFFALLNAADCYPFCVEVDPCGLWILNEPSDDYDRGFFEENDTEPITAIPRAHDTLAPNGATTAGHGSATSPEGANGAQIDRILDENLRKARGHDAAQSSPAPAPTGADAPAPAAHSADHPQDAGTTRHTPAPPHPRAEAPAAAESAPIPPQAQQPENATAPRSASTSSRRG